MSRSTRMHMNSRTQTILANKEQTGPTIRGKDYVDSMRQKGTQATGKVTKTNITLIITVTTLPSTTIYDYCF